MMKNWIASVMAALALVAWAGPEGSYDRSTDHKKLGWMDRGMELVKQQLKDPRSAQFDGVYFHRGSDNIPMTCGRVNAKNAMGGYAGFQRFISAGKAELTYLEDNVADFGTLWQRFCR
jgi:hypothetical protein